LPEIKEAISKWINTNARYAAISMTPRLATPMVTFPRGRHLISCPMTGYARCAGLLKVTLKKYRNKNSGMIENLSREQIAGILETLPVDITFVDENDTVRFWNKNETRVIKRPASALGGDVRKCHTQSSVARVDKLISDFKSGRSECTEYQIKIKERTINIKNIAVRDKNGKYLGIMEVDQDITDIKKD
jgi:DUF438 domain-containing protein